MQPRDELTRKLIEATAQAKTEQRSPANCPKVQALLSALREARKEKSKDDSPAL